jgi:hypothetical protein
MVKDRLTLKKALKTGPSKTFISEQEKAIPPVPTPKLAVP